jgi:hypothetical protein
MKRLFKYKYPKLFSLIVIIFASYLIFKNPEVVKIISNLGDLGYLGVFIAGLLFSFGFTSPISAGFFLVLNPKNILLASIIGGLGAMFADLFIFKFIRLSFKDEFNRLKKEKISIKTKRLIKKILDKKIRVYLMYILAGGLIASPLPDEAGVILLAGLTKIKARFLAIIGFILNTFGILVLFVIGNTV